MAKMTLEDLAEKRIVEARSELLLVHLGLRRVPESIRKLRHLSTLNLSLNQLTEVPSWIGELDSLRYLFLDGNHLRQIPAEIAHLPNLRSLNLAHNDLESLPETLQVLPLKELRLEGNPALCLPESILAASPKEILRYFFESRADDSRPLLELKLLLVGRGKAGKTTIVKRLANESPDENESETHSIDIRELTLECLRGDVQTRVWDFGGQEILHSTHQFFLTER